MKQLVVLVFLLVFALPAKAVFFADQVLEQSQLMQMYATMLEQLQSMKAQQEALSQLKKLYKEANETYKFVKYFDANRIVKEAQTQMEMVTGLDDMAGKTLEQKLDIIDREMDRRIADAKTETEQERLLKRKGELTREMLLIEMESIALRNNEMATNDIGVKESSQITAQSSAQMAALAAAEAKNAEKQKARSQSDRESRDRFFDSSGDIYQSLGNLDN